MNKKTGLIQKNCAPRQQDKCRARQVQAAITYCPHKSFQISICTPFGYFATHGYFAAHGYYAPYGYYAPHGVFSPH